MRIGKCSFASTIKIKYRLRCSAARQWYEMNHSASYVISMHCVKSETCNNHSRMVIAIATCVFSNGVNGSWSISIVNGTQHNNHSTAHRELFNANGILLKQLMMSLTRRHWSTSMRNDPLRKWRVKIHGFD